MKLAVLSVILLTALVELVSSVAIAQRGLSSGQSADRPSAPSNTRVAQNSAPPDPGELFRDCDNCPELVVVPPGDFVMGSNETPYEKPEHSISIRKPFAIGRREVTFAEWDQCADAGACKARPDDHGWGRGDRPVINVSWFASPPPPPASATQDRTDVLLALFDPGTAVAGVFTQSKCPSAPVEWCRAKLKGARPRALVVNSGNANAFTGKTGRAGLQVHRRARRQGRRLQARRGVPRLDRRDRRAARRQRVRRRDGRPGRRRARPAAGSTPPRRS